MKRRLVAIVAGLILLGAIAAALLLRGVSEDFAAPTATVVPAATPTRMPEIFATDRL